MRVLLTWMSALLLSGCLGRGNPDLLQARLREQQAHLAEVERQMTVTQGELQRSRRDAEQLRAQLARSGNQVVAAEYSESLIRVNKLQISSLISGGLNRDDEPGDDAFVALISLVDDDGEVVKLPGSVELSLFDPALPEPQRQVGQWKFSGEQCRAKWTRGFTGTGYQFTVPLDQPVQHEQLVLHAKLTVLDGRSFDASQIVKVAPPTLPPAPRHAAARPADEANEIDDINDPPPPAADEIPDTPSPTESQLPDWAEPTSGAKRGAAQPLRDSTNWPKDSIPQYR